MKMTRWQQKKNNLIFNNFICYSKRHIYKKYYFESNLIHTILNIRLIWLIYLNQKFDQNMSNLSK